MLLFVGLGNPGRKHENQRHNIGFMAVDAIHRHGGFGSWKSRFHGEISEGTLGGEKIVLLKPETFMNESGRAVGEAARFYKLRDEQITVFYDELDLAPGKVRVKTGGGAGGHNGIRSIDQHVANGIGKDYRRVRLGIGHPGHKDRVTGHVLNDFSKADHVWLDPLLDEVARNADLLAKRDAEGFMNRIALRTSTTEPPGARGQNSAKTTPKAQSHVRQARPAKAPDVPTKGPMADMLAKILGRKD